MQAIITVEQLVHRYGDKTALNGMSFEVGKGEVFGLLGPNGAGKTTTIRMLLDLIRPTGGTATVLGHDPRSDGVDLRARARLKREHVPEIWDHGGKGPTGERSWRQAHRA